MPLFASPSCRASHRAVLDGEVVAFEDGRPNFGRLQQRIHLVSPVEAARRAGDNPVAYVILDLLHLDGHDLTGLTYLQRRSMLTQLVDDHPSWRVPAHHLDDGAGLLEVARQQGLEGILAKRQDSVYLPGRRSPSWVKVKVRNRQEFVIGGCQPGAGNRQGQLGSLVVGYYAPDRTLRYAGRVGTGFNATSLRQLGQLLADVTTTASPFDPQPPPALARTVRWVRPELVAEVTFGEWTSEGILRHASYIGLRSDKQPEDVIRET